MSWCNQLMKWNTSQWNGIEKITVSATRLWTPDIVLYNAAEGRGELDMSLALVVLHHDGRHNLLWPSTFHSSCAVNAQYFPFDTQTCKLKVPFSIMFSSLPSLPVYM